jgi:peptide/nickel transport system permease protein
MAIALDPNAPPHLQVDAGTLSLNQLIVRRFMRHRLAVVGVVMLLVIVLAALFAPLLTPYDPAAQDLFAITQPPSREHPLGTDELGRDLLARLLYGGRVSLTVGIASALIATAIGVGVGAMAGYYGGWVDNLLMRLVDVLLAFPAIFLLLILFAIIRPSLTIVILFLGLFGWLYLARVVRGEFLALREKEFVEASRALGVGSGRLIIRHLLPNVIGSIIVATTLAVAFAMLSEGTLSFLGYGVPASTPTWGNMLNAAQSYYLQAPLMTIAPGLALTLTVLAINFIGDGLRDALDPRA